MVTWLLPCPGRAADIADSAITMAPTATVPKRVFLFMIVTSRAFRARVITPGSRRCGSPTLVTCPGADAGRRWSRGHGCQSRQGPYLLWIRCPAIGPPDQDDRANQPATSHVRVILCPAAWSLALAAAHNCAHGRRPLTCMSTRFVRRSVVRCGWNRTVVAHSRQLAGRVGAASAVL